MQDGNIDKLAFIIFPEDSPSRDYFSKSDLTKLNIKYKKFLTRFDRFLGYHLYDEIEVPDVYVVRYYALKYHRQPALLKMRFYKPEDTWRIQGMGIDMSLYEHLEK